MFKEKSVYGNLLKEMGAAKYMEFRRSIINSTEPAVTKQQLLCAYCLNEKTFRRALEDMSLMPVDVEFVLYCMGRNGWTVEAMYDAYCSNRTRRIESIISVPYSCSQKVQTLKAI